MTTEDTPQNTGQTSAGAQLRKAREAAGLSVAEVAERQHLRPSIIQAIENGDYQQIDSELFLKGYVRAYAGQVGLSPDEMVTQLNQELEPLRREREMAEEQNPLQDIERRKTRKKRVARLVVLLAVLGFLAYVGFRMLAPPGEVIQETGAPEVEAPAAPETAPVAEEPVEVEPEPASEPLSAPEPEQADVAAEPEVLLDQESVVEGEPLSSAPEPTVVPEPELATQPEPEARVAEPGVDAPPVPAPPAVEPEVGEPEPTPEVVPSGPDVALAASFVAPCWVEITDANGQRLVAALFNSGDDLRVQGEPPMRVVLGAADAVSELQFRGEIIDLTTYRTVNNRVEFTLDI